MATSDEDYVYEVRKFSSTSILQACTTLGLEMTMLRQPTYQASRGLVTQWALADIARVAMTFGNQYRSRQATVDDLGRLSALYNDQDVDPDQEGIDQLEQLLGLQTAMQTDVYFSVSRTLAILSESSAGLKEIRPGWDTDLLGTSIDEYITAGYLTLMCLLATRRGVTPEELRAASQWYSLPPNMVNGVLRRHFVYTPEEHKTHDQHKEKSPTRRFQPSPLYSRPLVNSRGLFLAPAPMLVAHKLSPRGIMYIANDTNDPGRRNRFATDMGVLFERYVGSQLRLIQPTRIEPEQAYDGDHRTVDWVLELEDLVVLVEVKLFPADQTIRMGGQKAADRLNERLGKAVAQLATTNELITSRDDILPFVSRSARRVGLVVTLDGQLTTMVNSSRLTLPSPGIDWALLPVEDLEWLGSLPPELGRNALLRTFDEKSPTTLRAALRSLVQPDELENPVLDHAMDIHPLVKNVRRGVTVATATSLLTPSPSRSASRRGQT